MRVLLVEDDPRVCADIEKGLISAGHECVSANDGSTGLALALSTNADVIILDIMLPLLDGFSVLEQLRSKKINTPVLLLSAKSEVDDKVKGLRTGANDYLTKPFHNEELLARTKALIRRASGQANPVVQFGPVALDTVAEEIRVDDAPLDLTAYEYKVMEYLMLNPQKVVSKTELTEHIYDQDFDLDSNVIEVFIGRLRKKIDPSGVLKPIDTLRGRGYRINRNL